MLPLLPTLPVAATDICRASAYGAVGNGVADDRAALQAAIDDCPAGGAVLLDAPGGTYRMTATGTGVDRRCLTFKSNIAFLDPSGVTVKLADNQATEGNPVVMFYIPTGTTRVYIGWPRGWGGTLDYNGRGQSGWTGAGLESGERYGQTNGCHHIAGPDGLSRVAVEGLFLDDCFSNPINLGTNPGYGLSSGAYLSRLWSERWGEGVQLIGWDDVFASDLVHVGTSAHCGGDYLEFSRCRRVHLRNFTSRSNTGLPLPRGGSGLDVYGSQDVVVDGGLIQGTTYGVQAQHDFNSPDLYWADRVHMTGLTVRNTSGQGLDVTSGRQAYVNCRFEANGLGGFQTYVPAGGLPADARLRLRLANVVIDGQLTPSTLNAGVDLDMTQVDFRSAGTDYPVLSVATGVLGGLPEPRLRWVGGRATGGDYGLNVSTGAKPVGRIESVDFSGQSIGPLNLTGGSDLTGLAVVNLTPTDTTSSTLPQVPFHRRLLAGGSIGTASLPKGSAGQLLTVTGEFGGAALTPGGRLRLADNQPTTLPTGRDSLTLRYDAAADVWAEESRAVTSIGSRISELPGVWTLTNPAAASSIWMGPAVTVRRASSVREIAVYNGDNGTAGTATVEVVIWGTPLLSTPAALYGGSTGVYAPGAQPIPAGSQVRLRLVTSGDWAASGNSITATGTLWE